MRYRDPDDVIQLVLARLVGAIVGAIVGYGAAKGIPAISPEAQGELAHSIATGLTLAVYGIVHSVSGKRRK